MNFLYSHLTGKRDMRLHSMRIPKLLRAMRRRPYWDSVSIWPDAQLGPDGEGQYPRLSLDWYPSTGYNIQIMELGSKDYFLATQKTMSAPEVYIELGGQGQELWPHELFVSYELAEHALFYFYDRERRDPSLNWVAIDAFPRKAVKPRKVRNTRS